MPDFLTCLFVNGPSVTPPDVRIRLLVALGPGQVCTPANAAPGNPSPPEPMLPYA